MAGFNYEKDLPHQNEAINAVMDALVGCEIKNEPKRRAKSSNRKQKQGF